MCCKTTRFSPFSSFRFSLSLSLPLCARSLCVYSELLLTTQKGSNGNELDLEREVETKANMDWLSVLEQGPRSRKRRGYLPFFCKVSPLLWRKICFVRTKEKKLIFKRQQQQRALCEIYLSSTRSFAFFLFTPPRKSFFFFFFFWFFWFSRYSPRMAWRGGGV